jgi:hypothetical protein
MNNQKKFLEYRDDILKVLNEKMSKGEIKIQEKVTLVDGFFMQSFQDVLQGIQLGGRTVPSIMLVGESGQIYFFAIKVILPNIEI